MNSFVGTPIPSFHAPHVRRPVRSHVLVLVRTGRPFSSRVEHRFGSGVCGSAIHSQVPATALRIRRRRHKRDLLPKICGDWGGKSSRPDPWFPSVFSPGAGASSHGCRIEQPFSGPVGSRPDLSPEPRSRSRRRRTPQRVQGDLRGAVEAYVHHGDPRSPGRITLHVVVPPGTRTERSRAPRVAGQRVSAGEADLPAMRMPAEHQTETRVRRVAVDLR